MKIHRKKKGVYVKLDQDVKLRRRIQRLAWDKGWTTKAIAKQVGLTEVYIRQIVTRRECECGEQVARGCKTCARCEHLEANQQLYKRDKVGVGDKDVPFIAYHRQEINARCEAFFADRGI